MLYSKVQRINCKDCKIIHIWTVFWSPSSNFSQSSIQHCNKSLTVCSPFVRFISHLCAVPYYIATNLSLFVHPLFVSYHICAPFHITIVRPFYSSFAAAQRSLFLRYFSCPDNSFPSIIMFSLRVLFRAVTRIEISLMKTKAEDTKKSLFGLKPTKIFNPEVIESFRF